MLFGLASHAVPDSIHEQTTTSRCNVVFQTYNSNWCSVVFQTTAAADAKLSCRPHLLMQHCRIFRSHQLMQRYSWLQLLMMRICCSQTTEWLIQCCIFRPQQLIRVQIFTTVLRSIYLALQQQAPTTHHYKLPHARIQKQTDRFSAVCRTYSSRRCYALFQTTSSC